MNNLFSFSASMTFMRNWISCVLKFSCSGNCEWKVTGRQSAWGFSTENVKALTVTCVRAVSTPRPTPENTEPLRAYKNCNLPKIWRGSVYGSKQLYACRNICSQLLLIFRFFFFSVRMRKFDFDIVWRQANPRMPRTFDKKQFVLEPRALSRPNGWREKRKSFSGPAKRMTLMMTFRWISTGAENKGPRAFFGNFWRCLASVLRQKDKQLSLGVWPRTRCTTKDAMKDKNNVCTFSDRKRKLAKIRDWLERASVAIEPQQSYERK